MFPIETKELCKRYRGAVALSGVTLGVPAGAVYALVGANGAGKTTLIRLLMNILRPSSGAATVLGVASSEVAGEVFERIGYVSENQEIPEGMTVRAFLAYARGFYPTWDGELEAQLLREFGLPLERKLKNLSRGMKMKAVLISVLAFKPSLIVLDEPFSGLDPLARDEFIQGLMGRAADATVLLSSHDLTEIESFATHVGFLEGGRLLFSEEAKTMAERFREVEVVMSEGAVVDVAALPKTWLQPVVSGNVLRFVDSQFSEDARAQVAERFSGAELIKVTAMPLRAMFLAIARAGKASAEGLR